MTPTYRNSDNGDAAFTRPAMSEARRLDIYGKLLPMDDDKLSWLQWSALIFGPPLCAVAYLAVFG